MTRRRPSKYKITPVEAQRRRVQALERWVAFVTGKLEVTPETFSDVLLIPTFWSVGGKGGFTIISRPSAIGLTAKVDVEEVKRFMKDGFEKITSGREWVLRPTDLSFVINQLGTNPEGTAVSLGQFGVVKLLDGEEWRIARCSWCGEFFPKKKRGAYCSIRCSQHMRTWKVRDRHWKVFLAESEKANTPIATWLSQQQKKPGEGQPRTTCPSCKHKFGVPKLPLWARCVKCKKRFVAMRLNANGEPITIDKENSNG